MLVINYVCVCGVTLSIYPHGASRKSAQCGYITRVTPQTYSTPKYT